MQERNKMANISLTLYTNVFFGSVLKSPTQMGSLSINNSVTNISRLGTFKVLRSRGRHLIILYVVDGVAPCVCEEKAEWPKARQQVLIPAQLQLQPPSECIQRHLNIIEFASKNNKNVLQRKSHLCIPILEIARPQSSFPNSCVCERFIYSQDRSTYLAAGK